MSHLSGQPRGHRGGHKPRLTPEQLERQREIRKEAHRHTSKESATSVVGQLGQYYECLSQDVQYNPDTEQVELVPVVDKSLTTKQHLRLWKPEVEKAIEIKGRQLEHKGDSVYEYTATGTRYTRKITPADTLQTLESRMVPVSDQRILKMSDKSLLYQDKPESKMPIYKRLTSKSKRVVVDRDAVLSNRPDRGDTLPEVTRRVKVVWRTLKQVQEMEAAAKTE